MKTALKILGLVLIVIITMASCETGLDLNDPDDWKKFNPDDLHKLRHIRPTKPIRIPDTIAIQMRPDILENPFDTTSTSQDSIPQEQAHSIAVSK